MLKLLMFVCIINAQAGQPPVWKSGASARTITPKEDLWLAGYASRIKPAAGKMHDLWAKALVLEDQHDQKVVFVSTDLLGIPRGIAEAITRRLETECDLQREAVVLNSSHTHSGPVLKGALVDIYELDASQHAKIAAYSEWLIDQVVGVVKDALDRLEESGVYAGTGFSRFQVNRRNNSENQLTPLTELIGPNDYSVPIIKVLDAQGKIKVLLFSYACHATVLGGYEWSGDYVGFAQLELEKRYPGCQAMFVQGAGADQNPLPRRTAALAIKYGKILAAAVEQVLSDDAFERLEPSLMTSYTEIGLPLEKAGGRNDYLQIMEEGNNPPHFRAWAKRMLGKLDAGAQLDTVYPYPVQLVRLGKQPIFALGGELVVEYTLNLKEAFGEKVFVFGYCNDVMAYIPSEKILQEGGYEGNQSQKAYGMPAKWAKGIESLILAACRSLYHNEAMSNKSTKR